MTDLEDRWNRAFPDPDFRSKEREQKDNPTKSEDINGKNKGTNYYLQKYSIGNCLSEAVIVNGLPFFLQIVDNEPRLVESISLPDMTIKPLDRVSYISEEYSFESLDEIREYIKRANNESFDSIYQKVKAIWIKYIDADNDHLAICSADTIFTYFQDRIGTTHYLFFVGDNNTGKSNNLVMFQYLGYRPMFDTSVTAPNIFRYLGGVEEGQGIILEDELNNLDYDTDKKKIYQVGYTSGAKVTRTNETIAGRKQERYFVFGFKAFSSERTPDSGKSKGFNERILVIPCAPGDPKYDISEVINPAGDKEHSELLTELLDIRKLLLIFRLLNHDKDIPNIQLNVKNRDKQLSKPVIRLFQNTKAVQEVIGALSKYLLDKNRRKVNTFDARLFFIIRELVKNKGPRLLNSDIWDVIKQEMEGYELNQQSYITEDFGQITKTKVTKTCIDRFGAQYGGNTGKSRFLLLDQKRLSNLDINYSSIKNIEIVHTEKTDTLDTFYSSKKVEAEVSLNKHNDLERLVKQNSKNSKEIVQDKETIDRKSDSAIAEDIKKVSQVSEVSVNFGNTKNKFLKCPFCNFKNIHPETIEHHIKYKHIATEN